MKLLCTVVPRISPHQEKAAPRMLSEKKNEVTIGTTVCREFGLTKELAFQGLELNLRLWPTFIMQFLLVIVNNWNLLSQFW